MRNILRPTILSRLLLNLGVLVLLPCAANADLTVDNVGLYGGGSSPIDPNGTLVEVSFTGNNGVWTFGDALTATNWKFPDGSYIPLYCIDLLHDTQLGSSYPLTTWTNRNSFSTDTLNRIAWAVNNVGLAGYGPGAAQLLIWSIIDPNFKVLNWNGNGSLQTTYGNLVSKMNSNYNPQTTYQAEFFNAIHQPSNDLNQDLVVGTPEPSTIVIACAGALGLVGYGRYRRRGGSI